MAGNPCISIAGENQNDPIHEDEARTVLGTEVKRSRKHRSNGRFARMPRSFGKYPFPVVAAQYLEALKDHRADVTLRQIAWDLETVKGDIRALKVRGRVTTENPYKLTVGDVAALIGYWRVRPRRGKGRSDGKLDPTSQNHLFKALKGLLEWCGNGSIGQLKTRPEVEIPAPLEKPIRTLSEVELARLRIAAESMDGWHGSVARFLVAFCPESGLRPKEVRLQELGCVDIEARLVLVCRPKGEGVWVVPHTEYAPLGEAAVQPLKDFMAEREAYLAGESHPALLPFRHADGRLDYWPPAMLNKVKGRLERLAGVRFQIRTFRSTFGQRSLDGGARIEFVSRSMRHKSTGTTEKYYARVRPDRAFDEVRKALAKAVQTP